MIARRWQVALGAAAVWALATPTVLLAIPAARRPVPAADPVDRVTVRGLAPLSAAFERTLFAAAAIEAEPLPEDAPALAGIVGRIDRDAVAMVRSMDGSTRTLAIGDSVDGWRLESLAIDAAFFTRGGQRVRVPLPAGD